MAMCFRYIHSFRSVITLHYTLFHFRYIPSLHSFHKPSAPHTRVVSSLHYTMHPKFHSAVQCYITKQQQLLFQDLQPQSFPICNTMNSYIPSQAIVPFSSVTTLVFAPLKILIQFIFSRHSFTPAYQQNILLIIQLRYAAFHFSNNEN